MKTIQSISFDAKCLYERLAKAEVGETIAYGEMSALISRDVQNSGRGVMETARRKALQQDQIVFGNVMNVGLKRLADTEIVATGAHAIRKISRCSRKGLKTITAVGDFAALPNDMKINHNAYASALGAFAHFSKTKSIKKIQAAVEQATTKLPLMKTLDAFRT